MHKLSELAVASNNTWIKEITGIFEPLLQLIALDEEFFRVKQSEFREIVQNEKPFNVHPFHIWFQNLLKNVIILESQTTYDTIRDLFLHRFPLQAPNCLQCPDEHGCCHSTYSIENIDYKRIIANRLIDPLLISRFLSKYKLKLNKDKTGKHYCGAFDVSTKKCIIHQFKPSTCCKYPLISNIQNWSSDLMAWTGNCAHCDTIWATRVHPAIMNICRDLWVKAQLLWESEQNLIYRIKEPIDVEIKEIISRILSIKQCSWPYKMMMMKKILLEDYPEAVIQKAFQMFKSI